jgi:flagella basal body P-ring formation protein FlgA
MKTLAIGLFTVALLAGLAIATPPTQDLENALLDQIASQLAVERFRLTLGPSELPQLAGPLSDYRFEFGAVPRGRTVVRGLSQQHKQVTFTIDVRLWDSAWVVVSPVERGEVLSAERFSRSWQDVTDLAVWSGQNFSEVRARRTLRPGTVLSHDAVESVPLVWRGRPVTVAASASGIKVSRTGVALADARLGEPVRVRVDRHTIISATATGTDLCVVGF